MAIYLQKTFDLSSPPIPAAPGSVSIVGSQLIEGDLASPPAGWNRPVPTDSAVFNPNLTNVIMLEEVGALNSGTGA
jgi:hypothetical protein